jgi:hypothetical protein
MNVNLDSPAAESPSSPTEVRLSGSLMGYRQLAGGGRREIVMITEEQRPRQGPAAKSMVSIRERGGRRIACYVPWINYYDLDVISRLEPGEWTIVEPAEPYEEAVRWDPYNEAERCS